MDEAASLGQVGHCRLAGGDDLLASGVGVGADGALRRPQEQLDAGQPLRQGVVDLPGEALSLGEDAGGSLRLSEVVAGGGQLGDQEPALLALAVQGLVPSHRGHDDRGADERAQDAADLHAAGVPRGPADRHQGRHDDGRQTPPARQVQLEEEQREGEPHRVRSQDHQPEPSSEQGGQPHSGRVDGQLDHRHQRPGHVDHGRRRGGPHHDDGGVA